MLVVTRRQRLGASLGRITMSDQNRILCTHVGSLARPARLLDFISAIDKHVPVQQDAFESCANAIVESSVRARGSESR